MVLILVAFGSAQAAPKPAVFEAAVSAGTLILADSDPAVVSDGALRRIDAGVGIGALHVAGFASWSLHNGTWYGALEGTGSPIAGDFHLTRVGGVARWGPSFGRFAPSLRGEVGAITFLSPFDPDAYEQEVLPYTQNDELGIVDTGLLVGGGVDAAFAIIPEHAWAGLSIDGAYNTLPGFGIEVGVRVGLMAAL